MKKLIFVIPLICVFISVGGQAESISTSFYPLEVGNYWEYKGFRYDFPDYEEWYYSIEVVGDTIMPNELTYKKLIKRNIPDDGEWYYFFDRVDSLTANIYRYDVNCEAEYLLDSLQLQVDDMVNAGRQYPHYMACYPDSTEQPIILCSGISEEIIFGIETAVKYLEDISAIPGFTYQLAEDLGYIGGSVTEFMTVGDELKYAVIAEQEYGISVSIEDEIQIDTPAFVEIFQNYPNPFNPSTIIKFELATESDVTLAIYDVSGKLVKTLVNDKKEAGYHSVIWDGTDEAGKTVNSGIYLYRIQAGDYTETKQCIMLK